MSERRHALATRVTIVADGHLATGCGAAARRRLPWPRSPGIDPAPWRIVTSKFLELRKRRGLIVAVLLLTIGILVVIDAIFLILHAAAPAQLRPGRRLAKFRAFSLAFVQTFGIAAILVGAAAGSSDLSDGVFRHLVVTGRSRLALFIAKVPAGLMLIIPITALAYTIEAIVAVYFAPSGNVPTLPGITRRPLHQGAHDLRAGPGHRSRPPLSIHLLVVVGLWLMLQVVVAFVLGLGLGALTGSRYATVAILIAMQLIVTPLLSGVTIPHLINLQRAFIGVALAQLEPSGLISIGGGGGGGGGGGSLFSIAPMPRFGLAIVITAWVVGWLALGAWRSVTRDA